MEVLAAFIREHSHEQWPPPGPDSNAPERGTRPDVQAALTVIGHRDTSRDHGPINLARSDLTRAGLGGANLSNAHLRDTNLTGA